jgi:hypothetical protein
MNDPNFIFQYQYCGNLWRVQITEYEGRPKAVVMPWWHNRDGELCPSQRKNALHMPLECLWELGEAIMAAKASNDASGA